MASFQSLKRFSIPKRDSSVAAGRLLDQRRRQRAALRVVQQGLIDDIDTPIPRFIRPARAGETKGMDTDISTVGLLGSTNTNGNILPLNLIQQGSGSWNRVGRKTHLTSVRLKGNITFVYAPVVATGVLTIPACRLVLVWDRQPSGGAIPSFDTIFGITAQDGTESCPDVTCPLKYDNMDRFVVIKDMYFNSPCTTLTSTGSAPQTTSVVSVDEYVKLKGLESVYSGQSAPMTIADISTGALYLVMRSQYAGVQSQVTVDGIARLRYAD